MKKIYNSKFILRVRAFARTHKKTSIAIALVILVGGYYGIRHATATTGETTYVLGTVERGTIVSSISGSGQVSSNRSLDLKPKASGDVVYIGAVAGQKVAAGQLIVQLDDSDAQKSVRDAEANLASAQLSMEKLQEPADSLTLLQAQNALTQAQSDLAKEYEDSFNTVSDTFLDLPGIVTGLDTTLHGTDAAGVTNGQQNISFYADSAAQFEKTIATTHAQIYKADAEQKYQAAKAAYDKNFTDFKNTDRDASTADKDALIEETYETTKLISDAVKSASNLIQYYQDTVTSAGLTPVSKSNTHITNLSGFTGKIDGHVSDLLSTKNTIASDETSIPEKQASLDKLKAGADALDVQSEQLSLQKSENSLQDAKDTLDNYYIRAPFAGTLATVDVKKGDSAGSGTAVATLIADDQVVDISLNEVDIAKVSVGQKATLTFDAIDGLTLTGRVAAIDTVGTVSQGVVNYTVTVGFDSTDPRVRPGMSVSASIITDVQSDVLTVPASAVKTSAGGSYVLAFDTPPAGAGTASAQGVASDVPPTQIPVTVGTSDDTNTEIVSGLTEGQQIVTRTVAAAATAAKAPTAASATSLLGGGAARGAVGGGGGAAFRGGAR